MKTGLILLTSICLLALLHQPTIKWKPRRVRGLFIFSKDKCGARCKRKHGYFLDLGGQIQDASVAKIYLLKCQCMVSKELKALIVNKFGQKAAKSYSKSNFFGFTGKARARLEQAAIAKKIDPIKFLPHAQLAEHIEKEQKAREGREGRKVNGQLTQEHQHSGRDGGVGGEGTTTTLSHEELTPNILEQLLRIKAKEEGKPNTSPASPEDAQAKLSTELLSMTVKLTSEESKEFERLVREQKEKENKT